MDMSLTLLLETMEPLRDMPAELKEIIEEQK